jgi:hypothetical protein
MLREFMQDAHGLLEIVALYRLSVPATLERNLPARYNICPTDTIDAVIERESKIDADALGAGAVVVEKEGQVI